MPFITATQVAWWLDLSETTVLRQEQDGSLPPAWRWGGEPLFSADVVLPAILQDAAVNFMGGVTLKTSRGPRWFELIKPTYRFEDCGEWCAVFETRDLTWHVRPWVTAYMVTPQVFDHHHFILDCRDERTTEIGYEDLPDLRSVHYGFRSVVVTTGDFARGAAIECGGAETPKPSAQLGAEATTAPI